MPGAIADGQTGDVACDHYHRYAEDVALMAALGARAYRFSVSWSRVLPEGTGAGQRARPRLLRPPRRRAPRAPGIRPLANLFHWDLPQALQDEGGFADPRIVGWFADYAELVAAGSAIASRTG